MLLPITKHGKIPSYFCFYKHIFLDLFSKIQFCIEIKKTYIYILGCLSNRLASLHKKQFSNTDMDKMKTCIWRDFLNVPYYAKSTLQMFSKSPEMRKTLNINNRPFMISQRTQVPLPDVARQVLVPPSKTGVQPPSYCPLPHML